MSILADLDCLGCNQLADPACSTVVLMNGRTVCSSCPAHLFECEARELASEKHTREKRIEHLRGIQQRRGDEEARKLKAAMIEIYERRA